MREQKRAHGRVGHDRLPSRARRPCPRVAASARRRSLSRPAGWPSDGAQCPSGTLRTAAQSTTVTITAPPSPGTYSYVLQFSSSDSDVTTNSSDSRVAITLSVVGKLSQTITFPPIADRTYGDPDFAPGASASSGLPVSYTASGSCTMSGGNVSLLAAGSCTVTASQAGNATYDPAPDVSRSFTIAKAGQTITFDQPASPQVYDSSFAVSASASSGLGVSIVASGVCTYDGMTGLVTMTSGTGNVHAHGFAGRERQVRGRRRRRSAPSSPRRRASRSRSRHPSATYGDSDSALGATASSELPVSYERDAGVCTVVGGDLHVVAAGELLGHRQPGRQRRLSRGRRRLADLLDREGARVARAQRARRDLQRLPQGAVVDDAGRARRRLRHVRRVGKRADGRGQLRRRRIALEPELRSPGGDGDARESVGSRSRGLFTAAGKVDDGNVSPRRSRRSGRGRVPGDDVALTASRDYADGNVSGDKVVALAGASLSGADAHNYLLGSVQTATADIEPKASAQELRRRRQGLRRHD